MDLTLISYLRLVCFFYYLILYDFFVHLSSLFNILLYFLFLLKQPIFQIHIPFFKISYGFKRQLYLFFLLFHNLILLIIELSLLFDFPLLFFTNCCQLLINNHLVKLHYSIYLILLFLEIGNKFLILCIDITCQFFITFNYALVCFILFRKQIILLR